MLRLPFKVLKEEEVVAVVVAICRIAFHNKFHWQATRIVLSF